MSSSKNKDLYEKAEAYTCAAKNALNAIIQNGAHPSTSTYPMTVIEDLDNGTLKSFHIEYKNRLELSIFIDQHQDKLCNLPEFNQVLKSMQSDEKINRHLDALVGTQYSISQRSAVDYLNFLVLNQFSEYSERFESLVEPFDKTKFHKAYTELEKFFYDDQIEYCVLAPLHNFECENDEVNLGEGYRIRKITNVEMADFIDSAGIFHMIPVRIHDMVGIRHVIEFFFSGEKIFKEIEKVKIVSNWESKLFEAITILRLFKSGNVGIDFIQTKAVSPIMNLGGSLTYGYTFFPGRDYLLKNEEISALTAFWEKYSMLEMSRSKSFDIATRRFNFAYERKNLEDKFLDFMIAFEALLFKKGEIGEFRHKLANRVARLLTNDYRKRTQISNEMKKFYDLRSKIVHGESVKTSEKFINQIENLLRDTILELIKRLEITSNSDIINQLDLG